MRIRELLSEIEEMYPRRMSVFDGRSGRTDSVEAESRLLGVESAPCIQHGYRKVYRLEVSTEPRHTIVGAIAGRPTGVSEGSLRRTAVRYALLFICNDE